MPITTQFLGTVKIRDSGDTVDGIALTTDQFASLVGTPPPFAASAIHLNGRNGNMQMGGLDCGQDGDIYLYPADKSRGVANAATIHLNGNNGNMRMGGLECGQDGGIYLFPQDKSRDTNANATIHLNGATGAIVIKDWSISVPDEVFSEDYQLPKLSELEQYVAAHRHLPKVPTAQAIVRDGIDVAQFSMLLLRKVEELTLHTIHLDARLSELEERLSVSPS